MYATTIFALLAIGGKENANVYEAALAARQTESGEDAYLNSVCLPNVTQPIIPPCQEITNIEAACLPNGTSSLDLLAHAECMCGGSYFSDWIGCLNCDFVHGARSPAVTSAFHVILSSASNELCTGTPTASFQALFSSLQYNVQANGTATVMSDLFPSQTAVSLYFTPTGVQGPGVITGSATAATKTSGGSAASMTGSSSAVVSNGANGGKTSSSASVAASTSSSSSSSSAGAAPTGVWFGGLGAVVGVVGMAVL